MQPSPRSLQTLGALLALSFLIGSLWLALRAPVLGIQFEADEGPGLVVQSLHPVVTELAVGDRVLSLGGVPLRADLVVEEPDVFEEWPRYLGLLADMTRLDAVLQPGGEVRAALADGRQVDLAVHERAWFQLPLLFWFQVAVGVLSFLLAYGVWVFRWRDRAALHFAASGLGVLTFACCAAVYSTRELVLNGTWFQWLSWGNHLGAMLFTSALVMLLWYYPTRLGRRSPAWLVYGVAVVFGPAFVWRWTPAPAFNHVVVLGLFSLSFIGALMQWRRTRGQPLERVALKWYLLSIYIGTGLFAAAILVPGALGLQPFASQGLMFGLFLCMFVGIALGILRYRLFDLDRWWFGAWSWFLGGVAVLLMDVALVSLFDISHAGALSLSLALLGWVYFPLRQWLWARLAGRRAGAGQAALGPSLETLAAAADGEQLRQRWRQVLQAGFEPLEILALEGGAGGATAVPPVSIAENGLALRLPDLVAGGELLLRMPQAGARLFGRDDVARGEVLWRMASHVQGAMWRREQDVHAERGRIMRDLHDDLGGKLLSLVYLGQGEASQLARSALQDMRDILSALAADSCRLDDALQSWEAEARQRLSLLGRELVWSQDEALPGERRLSARQHTNLGRVVREAVTNSLKHADAQRVRVHWHWQDEVLHLRLEDEGREAVEPARTARTISERVQDLGGTVRWLAGAAGGTVVEAAVPVRQA